MKKCLFFTMLLPLLAFANVVSAQIQLTFTVVEPSCHGYTDGTATVNPSGGAGSYTYLWNNGQQGQTNFGLATGTYTVTVTDAATSTASASIFVSEPGAVLATITATDVSCDGTSGTLTANGFGGTPPYTYTWAGAGGPSSSQSVPVTSPGIYYLTVTDSKGCGDVENYWVPAPLFVDVVATNIPCSYYPNGGSVNATVSGGKTPYTFSWSAGGNTQILTDIPAGTYFVTVTGANGCTATDVATVTIPDPLEVEVVSITPACGGGNNGAATIQASGGTPPYTHTWTPGPYSGSTVTGLAPGVYYVCTFDANGCQKDLNIEIPVSTGLDVQLQVVSASCPGIDDGVVTAIVNPPGSGYVYQWNVPPFSGVTQLIGVAAGTIVSVTVTDPATGCVGTATTTVGSHNPLQIAIDAQSIPCAGGTGSITATASNGTPQYNYSWFSGTTQIGDQASISGLAAGAYVVSVTDANGCEAQTVANIGIISGPIAAIGGINTVFCGDSISTVQFTNLSTDPFNQVTQLIWTISSPSLGTQVINQQSQITYQLPVDEDGTVQLIAISGTGCADTTSLNFNVPGIPNISLSLDTASLNCTGGPVGIIVIGGDSSYAYVWNPAVVINPDPLHVLVNPLVPTVYTLTATDGGACTATASIPVTPGGTTFQLTVTDDVVQTCSATATLSATASIPNATIVWTDPAGNSIPGNPVTVPATPNTVIYTVTATSPDGCTQTKTVAVTGYGIELAIDANMPGSACEGTALPLSITFLPAGANLDFLWTVNAPGVLSNPTLQNPLLNGPAGNYTATVIASNDFCADTLEVAATIDPNKDLTEFISADLCKGRTVSFFNTSGMTGTWNFGDSNTSILQNPVHTYAAAGQYMVTFTPALLECVIPWDSMINVQQSVSVASIANNYQDCAEQAQILFSGTINNPGAIAWIWSFEGGTPSTSIEQNPMVVFTNEDTIIATLIVTDINFCLDTVSLPVPIHIINDALAESLSFCLGEQVQLNPEGIDPDANYVWTATPADPTLIPTDKNPIVSPLVATTYTVTISEGLCSVEYSIVVTPKEGSDVNLQPDTTVCNTNPLTLIAQSSNATTFQWSESPEFTNIFAITPSVQITPGAVGETKVYYVRTYSTAAECFGLDSIVIGNGTASILAAPYDDDICLGEETELLITNLLPGQVLQYEWSPSLPGIPNPVVSPTENATYTATVTNQYGCTATVEFAVNVESVSVTAEIIGPDTLSAGMSTVLLATPGGNSATHTYLWTPAGSLSDPTAQQPTASPDHEEVYTVVVTSANGCTATDEVTVHFRQTRCESPFIFVPKAFTPNNDQKNDYFIARGSDITEMKFIVWSRWGEIVYETNDPLAQGWDGTFKGKELTPDAYAWYLWVTCGNGEIFETKGNVTLLK